MRSMTGRLLVLILGLTLLSATAENAYPQQGCRGCDIRTAATIHRAVSNQSESGTIQPPQSISLDQIVEKYEQGKAKGDWIKDALLLGGLTVDEVVSEIGDVLPPSGLRSIVMSGGEILVRFGTTKMIMHVMEKADESARMILADGLEQYRQNHNGNFAGLLDTYKQDEIPGEGAFDLLFSKHPVYDTRLDDVRPEDQHVVNKLMIRALADIVEKGMEGINNLLREHEAAIAANRVDIAENRRNLTLLAKAFNRYVDEANKRFKKLATNQQRLRDAIVENRGDIAALQVIVFGTLTPKQQRQALDAGFLRDLPDAKRKELERRVQDAVNQQEMLETLEDMRWIAKGMGELAVIARNLGVDEEITGPVAVAAEVGVSAAVAVASFKTGQIYQGIAASLHGLAALTGAFREDKPDPVIENQRKILEALRAVMGGLEHIDQKLDQLFENQQLIVNHQRHIYALMVDIGKDIQAKHEDLVGRLYSLNTDVLVNRKLIRDRVEEKIRVCDGMRKDYANESDYRVVQANLEGHLKYGFFPDYQGIGTIVQASNPINNGCYGQLFGIFPGDDKSPHSYFQLETYKETPSDVTPADSHHANVEKSGNFLSLIYSPSLQLTVNHYADRGLSGKQILSAVSLPVTGLRALDRKHERAKNLPSYAYPPYPFEALQNYLSPDAVLKAVWVLLDIYPLYHFVDNVGSLLSMDELRNRFSADSSYNTLGEKWLEEAKNIVEVAIAQQALLAGDMLLPVIYENLHRTSSTREKKQIDSIRILLRKNPLLARNFMLYLVHRQLNEKLSIEERRLGLDTELKEEYRLAIAENDAHTLRWILDESAHYSKLVRHAFEQDGSRVEKWALKWGDDVYLPLPEADDLMAGGLLQTQEMSKLIELRSYIIEEIVGRRFVSNEDGLLNDSEYQLFNDLLFLHATDSIRAQHPLP